MDARGRRIYKLAVILLFLLATGILVATALVRRPADVEITLRVRELSFTVNDERMSSIFNSVDTKFITLSRYERLSIDGGDLRFMEDNESRNGWRAAGAPGAAKSIVPNVPFSNINLESVRLNWLNIQHGTNLVLSWSEDDPEAVNLSLDKAPTGEVAGVGTLLFSCTACSVEGVPATRGLPSLKFRLTDTHQSGQIARFQGKQELTVVALVLAQGAKLKAQDIDVRGMVNFTSLEGGRPVSTIIEGKIHFNDMGEEKDIKLDEGTLLVLNDLENAVIKTVGVENGINVVLSVKAGKLSTGTAGHVEDRRLSYFEWASTRQQWLLVLSASISFITMVLGLINWWRKDPESS